MKKYVLVACMATIALVVAAPASAQASQKPGQTSVVHDCAWAQKHTRFMAVRVKKVRKRVENGQLPGWKLRAARRILRQALQFQNQVCVVNQTPLALTESEVQARVVQRAASECNIDPFCVASGYYTSGGHLLCSSRTTYEWGCFGYNDENDGSTCDFREIVDRSGYNGITSHRDLSFGGSGGPGWDCH
jgi:hypothetical protein